MIIIKNKNEIDGIRESSQIVAETLQLVKSRIKSGVSTLELDKIAEDYIRINDGIPAFKGYSQAGSFDFPGALCTSLNEEVVHGIPSTTTLKEGDILSIDVGVLKNNFYGDAALTVAVGEIDPQVQKLMEVTEKALYIGIDEAQSGNRVGDMSNAIQDYVESNGFSVVRELCGHGVGKYLHEDPQIPNFGRKGSGPLLKNGMTFAIEPMVNMGNYKVNVAPDGWTVYAVDRKPSAHFEHTIAIVNGKPEILTKC